MPTGPVHSMPSSSATTATIADMMANAPALWAPFAATYIHTMPPMSEPHACVNQNRFAFMPSTIANTMNTRNRSTPKMASVM